MSWFNRKPRKNEPTKPHRLPHFSSPATERMMEEAKALGPNYKSKKRQNNPDK